MHTPEPIDTLAFKEFFDRHETDAWFPKGISYRGGWFYFGEIVRVELLYSLVTMCLLRHIIVRCDKNSGKLHIENVSPSDGDMPSDSSIDFKKFLRMQAVAELSPDIPMLPGVHVCITTSIFKGLATMYENVVKAEAARNA